MSPIEKHEVRDKTFRRLEREYERLSRASNNAPIVPLEHPYQRGWVKTYGLRRDVLRRPDVAAFQAALELVNQRVYARDRTFCRLNGDRISLHPRIVPVREFLKLGWPASHRRLFAYGHWRLDEERRWPVRYSRFVLGFKVARDWWLEESIQPHLITHRRVDLPEVKERIAEIEAYLTARCGWARLRRLHGRRVWWRDDGPTLADRRGALVLHENNGYTD